MTTANRMLTDQLIATTAFLFNVERSALLGTSRAARISEARHALAWAMRQNDWTLEEIGSFLHRDHTTIIYAIAAIERKASRNTRLAERLTVLAKQDASPPEDWQARLVALENKVAYLEKLLVKEALKEQDDEQV